MPDRPHVRTAVRPGDRTPPLPPVSLIGFTVAVVAVLVVALFAYSANAVRAEAAGSVSRSLQVIQQVQALATTLKDAESGQRGFLLTGVESYLQPFETANAVATAQVRELRRLTRDDPRHRATLDVLEKLNAERLQSLAEPIRLKRAGDVEGALAIIRSGRGRDLMDRIRGITSEMELDERTQLGQATRTWENAVALSQPSGRYPRRSAHR